MNLFKRKQNQHSLESFSSEGLEKKSYRSSLIPLLASFLKAWLCCSVAILVLFLFVDQLADDLIPIDIISKSETRIGIRILGLLIAVVWTFYWCNVRVEICRLGVIFYRAGKPYRWYPISAGYSLHIKRHYYRGIPSGSELLMDVNLGEGDVRVEQCYCLSKDDFSALEQDIWKIKRDGYFGKTAETDMLEAELFAGRDSVDFAIPKEELLRSERKRLIQIISICFGIGIVAFIMQMISIVNDGMDMRMFGMWILLCMMPGVLVSVIQGIRYATYTRALPKLVSLTQAGIRVDEVSFCWADIKSVEMTSTKESMQHSMASSRRRLTVTHRGDRKSSYFIGNVRGTNLVYPEYERLMWAMQVWCEQRQITFKEE